MAIRKIVTVGDDVLTKQCRKVTKFDARLGRLLDDMKETLAQANGVGLAAPQVGVLKQVVVVDTGEEVLELINPEIIEVHGSDNDIEGCLSVPDRWGYVERPTEVTVKAQDREGNEFAVTGYDLTARCFCHEVEHLSGHLFTERVTKFVTPEELQRIRQQEEE
jgi:peptide deformylase